jgi:hypothetical protein
MKSQERIGAHALSKSWRCARGQRVKDSHPAGRTEYHQAWSLLWLSAESLGDSPRLHSFCPGSLNLWEAVRVL